MHRRPARWQVAVAFLPLLASMLLVVTFAGRPDAIAAEPPPGGFDPSTPNVGRTEGGFSVSADGAAQYSLPLWVPAGRGVVTPSLSLSYSSRSGNGMAGVGWSLSGLSGIAQCSRTFAQDGYADGVHYDGSDALCLDGNRLLPISPANLPEREYRTEKATFARIIAYGMIDGIPDSFRVWAKDGTISTYGGTADALWQAYRLKSSGTLNDPNLTRESMTRVTIGWAVNNVADRNGNAANVTYKRAEGDQASLWWTQQVPWKITYAPNRTVEFVYDTRTDVIDGFNSGVHTRTALRLSRVEMSVGPQGDADIVRRYKLLYRDEDNDSITKRSLLDTITECDGGDRCHLPLKLDWSLGSYDFQLKEDWTIDTGDYRWGNLITGDFDGDGRGDLLYGALPVGTGALLEYFNRRNSSTGFGSPVSIGQRTMPSAIDATGDGRTDLIDKRSQQPFHLLQSTGTSFVVTASNLGTTRGGDDGMPEPAYLADVDGNGLPDFVGVDGEGWYYRPNTGTVGQDRFGPAVRPDQASAGRWGRYAVDTDGDGRTELIGQVGLATDCVGKGWVGWSRGQTGGTENATHKVRGCAAATHFADVNGDGLADAVTAVAALSTPGKLEVQLNSGNGFSSHNFVPNPTGFVGPEPISKIRGDRGVRIADVNGDGRDDVVILRVGAPESDNDPQHGLQAYVWTDRAFERAPVRLNIGDYRGVPGTVDPQMWDWNHTQFIDFDADGALDLVKVDVKTETIKVYQRQGGVPDRLIGIGDAATGPRTEIDYTTLADRDVHTPLVCAMPQRCVMAGGTVVKQHRTANFVGTTDATAWDRYNHTYTGARADTRGRGWLGFTTHTVTRVATGATTVTEFDNLHRDTTVDDYAKAGLPDKVTYTVKDSPNGREYKRITDNKFEVRVLTGNSYTVELQQVKTIEQERAPGGTWQNLHVGTTDTTYDQYGTADLVVSATTGGRKVTTDPTIRNDINTWLIGLPENVLTTACGSDAVCKTREVDFGYDSRGNPNKTVVEPNRPELMLTTDTVFGDFGQITSVNAYDNSGQQRKVSYQYGTDKLYPTSVTNPKLHKTILEFHSGLGVLLSASDANGATMTARYDGFGRLRQTNSEDGNSQQITYSRDGGKQTVTTTQAGGVRSAVVFDQLGREVRADEKIGTKIASVYTTYDVLGRVRQQSLPVFEGGTPQYTTTAYDNRDRVTSTTAADGKQVRYTYLNREVHTIDARGIESYTVSNVDGEVVSSFEDNPNSTGWLKTQFTYGPFGETTRAVAPDNLVQTMEYDLLGRRERILDSSTGITEYTYNGFGEIVTETDGTRDTSTYTYDELGRVTKVVSPDGTATNVWDTAPRGKGNLASATSADGIRVDYRYDDIARLDAMTWNVEGSTYEVAYEYDGIGRDKSLTYPAIGDGSRLKLTYGYDESGLLDEVKDANSGTAYWTALERTATGQLHRQKYGNGVLTRDDYSASTGLLSTRMFDGPLGTIGGYTYTYDNNRNVTGRTDHIHVRSETYGYDELNRLETWKVNERLTATYTYNDVGNLKTETVQGLPNQNVTYAYGQNGAPRHALTTRNGTTYRYDGAGRQISGDGRTVEYNRDNLPTSITWGQGKRTTFKYGPMGDRVVKRDDSHTVVSIGGVFERRSSGTEVQNMHNIVADGRVIAQIVKTQPAPGAPVTSKPLYVSSDLLGSSTLITNASGRIADNEDSRLRDLRYDPFGRRIGENDVPLENGDFDSAAVRFGFTSHVHDDEFGLINMGGRVFDPKQRQFLTPDPVVTAPLSSQNHNRYSYVLNNPATFTDPSGFSPEGCISNGDQGGCIGGNEGTATGSTESSGGEQRDFDQFENEDLINMIEKRSRDPRLEAKDDGPSSGTASSQPPAPQPDARVGDWLAVRWSHTFGGCLATSPEQIQVPIYVPDPSRPIYRSYTAFEKPTPGTEKIKGDPTDFFVNDAEATSPVVRAAQAFFSNLALAISNPAAAMTLAMTNDANAAALAGNLWNVGMIFARAGGTTADSARGYDSAGAARQAQSGYSPTAIVSGINGGAGTPPQRMVTLLGRWKGGTELYVGMPGYNVLNKPMRGAGKWTWHRNKEFITNAIKRGDEIRLITNPYVPAYRGGNTYQRELRFLRDRGYVFKPAGDGHYWVAVPGR